MNQIFEDLVKSHEQKILRLKNGEYMPRDIKEWLGMTIHMEQKRLCFYNANFKCENCFSKEKLTLQHFVKRNEKKFVPLMRYFAARHYYLNAAILCSVCHEKADNHGPGFAENVPVTSDEKLLGIKKYFEVK